MLIKSRYRCFLFLVNYARMRTEIAVKAIPVLEHVGTISSTNVGG